jgi:hypothetical protein
MYVLSVLAELTGMGVPIAVLPFVNSVLARQRGYRAVFRWHLAVNATSDHQEK